MIARVNMLLVAVAAGALLVAGCGGSDDSEAAAPEVTTSALTKAEFIEQANNACGKEKEKLLDRAAAYKPPAGSQQSPEEELAEKLKAVLIPTVEGEIAAIEALGAPKGEAERVEAILAAQQQGLEEASELTAAKTVGDVTRLFNEATKLAEGYGIGSCTVIPEPNAPEVGGS